VPVAAHPAVNTSTAKYAEVIRELDNLAQYFSDKQNSAIIRFASPAPSRSGPQVHFGSQIALKSEQSPDSAIQSLYNGDINNDGVLSSILRHHDDPW
jgi:hypothetical protein